MKHRHKMLLVVGISLLVVGYSYSVIYNPSVPSSKQTIYHKNGMKQLLRAQTLRWNGSTYETQNYTCTPRDTAGHVKLSFPRPVATILLYLHQSILDTYPERLWFHFKLTGNGKLMTAFTLMKTINTDHTIATKPKNMNYPNNTINRISFHPYVFEGSPRQDAPPTVADAINITTIDPDLSPSHQNKLTSVTVFNLSYYYYTEGKRYAPKTIDYVSFLKAFLPYMAALFVPYELYKQLKKRGGSP